MDLIMTKKLNEKTWVVLHASLMVVGGALFWMGYIKTWSVLAATSFAFLAFCKRNELKLLPGLIGPANILTGMRLIGYIIAGSFYAYMPGVLVAIILWSAVILDAADGWIARRTQSESKFGGLFDMETDAFYVAMFTMILVLHKDFHAWIILPGFLRYLYIIGLFLFRAQEKEEKRNPIARLLAGFLFIALPLPFVWDHPLARWLVYLASFGIVVSFGKSIVLAIQFKPK
jgi:phosphatidylglycerophosphate synthase